METKNIAKKIAPFIIVLLLVCTMFAIRAETVNLGGITDPSQKALYEDSNGLPYFTEIDSYYNYRLTENYLNTGHLGDKIVNGTDWDSLSTSPNGREANYTPLIIMLAAAAYSIANMFGTVPLTTVVFWLAPIIASLAVIPAFFIVKRATKNNWGATVAGIIAAAAPAYFSHTYGGFFDTDIFNVILPLMIVLFFCESMYAKNKIVKIIYAALSAGFLGLFSIAWSGYMYMVILMFGTPIFYMIVSFVLDKYNSRKNNIKMPCIKKWFIDNPVTIPLVVFIILASIILFITVGGSAADSVSGVVGLSSNLQNATVGSAYPNVYVSVGEMQIPQVIDVATQSGGVITFIFVLFGFLFMGVILHQKTKELNDENKEESENNPEDKKVRTKRYTPKSKKAEEIFEEKPKFRPGNYNWTKVQKQNNLFLFLLLLLWTVGIGVMLTQGTRFIEQFSVPMALMSGLFVGFIIDYLDVKMESYTYVAVIGVILLLLAVTSPIVSDYQTASQSASSTNDDMYNTLTWIKGNTAPDTVLASWWDFGHLFTSVADRQVVFDGGSQNNMRAYWIGASLTTPNQDLSAGILRMLANSGEDASNTLDLYTNDTGKSVEILNNILGLDKTSANNALTGQYGLTQQEANSVLDKTHPVTTKPINLILSSDMLSKASWWSYFGSWNFTSKNSTHYSYYPAQSKAENINGNAFMLGIDNGVVGTALSGDKANGTNMTYGYVDSSKLNKSLNMSDANDKKNMQKQLQDGTGNLILEPHQLIVVKNNQLTQRVVNNNSNMSIMVMEQSDGSYFSILFDEHLENSMFTKLYLESGMNVTRFNMTHSEPGISVWNVQEYSNGTSSNITNVSTNITTN